MVGIEDVAPGLPGRNQKLISDPILPAKNPLAVSSAGSLKNGDREGY
jgi:hypothetical protein